MTPTAFVLSIRRALPEEAEKISACLRSAFEPFRSRYTPEAFTRRTRRSKIDTGSTFFLADFSVSGAVVLDNGGML